MRSALGILEERLHTPHGCLPVDSREHGIYKVSCMQVVDRERAVADHKGGLGRAATVGKGIGDRMEWHVSGFARRPTTRTHGWSTTFGAPISTLDPFNEKAG